MNSLVSLLVPSQDAQARTPHRFPDLSASSRLTPSAATSVAKPFSSRLSDLLKLPQALPISTQHPPMLDGTSDALRRKKDGPQPPAREAISPGGVL
ncbi:hypothetical protein NL676_013489 [Syzygium grande]|nr:hypothetical protein NL676_013489 [Syzygium grande]